MVELISIAEYAKRTAKTKGTIRRKMHKRRF